MATLVLFVGALLDWPSPFPSTMLVNGVRVLLSFSNLSFEILVSIKWYGDTLPATDPPRDVVPSVDCAALFLKLGSETIGDKLDDAGSTLGTWPDFCEFSGGNSSTFGLNRLL